MSRGHLLVLDDHAGTRYLLHELLTQEGYTVKTTDNRMECLPIAKELDLVIMDAKMQSKSGLETLIKLKNANPALSIIMITACSEMPLLGKAIKIGLINYYLTKPFDLDQIRNLVRALVKKSR